MANITLFDTTIAEATRVTWEMLTLMPPAVLCTPEKFSENWHEVINKSCDKGSYYKLTYYRPLMLYCAHGAVAVKAIVGKKVSSQPTVNIEEDSKKGFSQTNSQYFLFKGLLTRFTEVQPVDRGSSHDYSRQGQVNNHIMLRSQFLIP